MTRAEQQALIRFPEQMTPLVYQELIDQFGGKTEIDFNLLPRSYFQLGYEQAEKDLALTPDDIKLIMKIHYEIVFMYTNGIKVGDVASEVLTRFKQFKEEKK